jgi:hypothetical protein
VIDEVVICKIQTYIIGLKVMESDALLQLSASFLSGQIQFSNFLVVPFIAGLSHSTLNSPFAFAGRSDVLCLSTESASEFRLQQQSFALPTTPHVVVRIQ